MRKKISQLLSGFSTFTAAAGKFFSRPGWFTAAVILITVLRICFGADRNIWEMNFPHDDLLYAQLAHHIARGEWLGVLNSLTLAKSCVFPAFLALSILSGIPYFILLDLLLCTVMYLGAAAVRPRLKSFGALLLYAALVFNPSFFLFLRLTIRPMFTIFIFGQIFCLIACWLRRDQDWKESIPWIFGSGLFFALAAHSREEGTVFICVFIGVYIVLLADAVFRKRTAPAAIVKAALGYILIPAAIFLGIKTAICRVNKHYYGIAETCMRNNRNYKGFCGSLLGAAKCLDPVWDIRIPLRYDILDQLYELSPSLKTLKPYISRQSSWHAIPNNRFPPEVLKTTPNLAENTKGGFIQWELLDAMQRAGYFTNGNRRKSDKFFKNVVRELKQAAKKGKIPGFKPRYSSLVPFSHQTTDWFITKFFREAETLFDWKKNFIVLPSLKEHIATDFRLHYAYSALKSCGGLHSEDIYKISGWGILPEEKQVLRAYHFSSSPVFSFQTVNRPDVQAHLTASGYSGIPRDAGFCLVLMGNRIKVTNHAARCILDRTLPDTKETGTLHMAKMLHIDNIAQWKAFPSIVWKKKTIRELCRFFQLYGKYLSLLAIVVLAGGISAVFFHKTSWKRFLDFFLPGLILWGSGFTYFCLIIFANVMLHCPRNAGYFMPAFALIYSGCWTILIAGCYALADFFRRNAAEDPTTPRCEK